MASEKKNTKQVSVIIVNYNTSKLLKQCLESLFKNTRDICFEVIVVDNNSQDDSLRMLQKSFPMVMSITSGENLGFGRANNLGVKYASGKYVFLLNSDTIVHNNVLKLFYEYMENHNDDRLGVVGCWLTDRVGNYNRSYGVFPSISTEILYTINKLKERISSISCTAISEIMNVDYVNGADLFIPLEVYHQLSGFDPHFFMYYEETDLQFRMMKMGYERRVIDGPQITHLDGGSFDQKGLTPRRFEMSQKSFNYYAQKNYSTTYWLLFRLFLVIWRLSILVTMKRWTIKERWDAYIVVLLNKK